jgi:hypothetical protein
MQMDLCGWAGAWDQDLQVCLGLNFLLVPFMSVFAASVFLGTWACFKLL